MRNNSEIKQLNNKKFIKIVIDDIVLMFVHPILLKICILLEQHTILEANSIQLVYFGMSIISELLIFIFCRIRKQKYYGEDDAIAKLGRDDYFVSFIPIIATALIMFVSVQYLLINSQ